MAQQVVADGTAQTASGTINTGVLPPTTGYALYSLNGGSITSTTPLTLTTGGAGSHAVRAESGGSILVFSGSVMTTNGSDADGLSATGSGSTITATNPNIDLNGFSGFAVHAADGGVVTVTGGTAVGLASALRVSPGGTIFAANIAVTSQGSNAFGAHAQNGTMFITGGSLTTVAGTEAHGISVSGSNGEVVADGVTVVATGGGVRTTGSGATASFSNGTITSVGTGVIVDTAGAVTLNNSTVTTNTVGAAATGHLGLWADGAGSTITATNVFVDVTPNSGTSTDMRGVLATGGGVIGLTGTVTVTGGGNGMGNYALMASGDGSQITYTGTATTSSRGSFGVLAEAGGDVILNSGTVIGTTGINTLGTLIGSHGLVATGAGSSITGTGVTVTAGGTLGQAARANATGLVTLSGGSLSTAGGGSALNPAAAAAAVAGGDLVLSGLTLTTTANFAHGMFVSGAGSTGRLTNGVVSIAGPNSRGILVTDTGDATVIGGAATSTSGIAVLVDLGSTLSLTGTAVETLSNTAAALSVAGGSIATVTGGSIKTNGLNAVVAQVGTNARLTMNGVAVSSLGDGRPYGLSVGNNGIGTIIGGTVETFGDATDPGTSNARRPIGLNSQGLNAILNATNLTVTTHGNEAFAVVADESGTANLTDVTVITEGTRGIGLYAITDQTAVVSNIINGTRVNVSTIGTIAHGAMASQLNIPLPATVNLWDSSLTTTGESAAGLRATLMGDVNTWNTGVATSGYRAHGMIAVNPGSSVNIQMTNVAATGLNAHGAVAESGGLVTGILSSVRASGVNAAGLFVVSDLTTVASAADFTTSLITNTSGPTVGVAGSGNIAFLQSTVQGSGQWLKVGTIADFQALAAPEAPDNHQNEDEIGTNPPVLLAPPPPLTMAAGLANITATRSTMTGSALTLPGSVSNLTLVDSTWNMTGSSNITNLDNDPSIIIFSPPTGDPTLLASYMTLTAFTYTGDGTLSMNTFLGDDSSPSDRLVIEDGGNATGTSGLLINNTTGLGDLTVADGILVVEALGTAVTGAAQFHLTRTVAAGPYRYDLHYQNLAMTDESWYLRSTIDCPLTGAPTPADPCIPTYRSGVALALAEVGLMDLWGRNLIDTLHERKGEDSPARVGYLEDDPDASPYWARVKGEVGTHQGDALGIYGPIGPSYDFNLVGLQAGADIHAVHHPDGSLDRAGVYGAAGGATADVTHHIPTIGDHPGGRAIVNAWSVGGYWTHYTPEGAYLDAVVQGTFYRLGMDDLNGVSGETNGFGVAGSLEAGLPLHFADGWTFEPQAQIIGQALAVQPFNDVAADVSLSHLGSGLARIGFRLAHDWTVETYTGDEVPVTFWARANLWHRFAGEPVATFSSANGPVSFEADLKRSWLAIGIGADVSVRENLALYGSFNIESTFDGGTRALSAKIGAKGTF